MSVKSSVLPVYPSERVGLFIDGANFYAQARGLQMDIDYRRLLQLFSQSCRLVRAFYYTAILEDQEFNGLKPLVDWLDYNGFTVVTKPAKEFTDSFGRRKIKGNMDIELAIDMLEMAPHLDHAVLFSGDGDFCRLLDAMKRRGVRTSVVSSTKTQPSMIADDLRRMADNFIELQDFQVRISRDSGQQRPYAAAAPASRPAGGNRHISGS